MTFKEIETFVKARRYIEKQGKVLSPVEKTNLKSMYKIAKEKDLIIGVQMMFCPLCNKHSDGGGLMMVTKGKTDEEIPKMMCMDCMDLSKLLICGYNFDDKDVHKVMFLIRKIREDKGI